MDDGCIIDWNHNVDVVNNTHARTNISLPSLTNTGRTVGTTLSLPVPAGPSQSPSDKSLGSAYESRTSASHDQDVDVIRDT